MSGESCPMLIYLSQEHRSDNDLFSSVCLIRVSVRPLPDPYKGNLHKKGGTRSMVTEFFTAEGASTSYQSRQCHLRVCLKEEESGKAERERKKGESRGSAPTQITWEALIWTAQC